jgi:outer membrane protein, heavy metal efflux system
LFSAIGDDEHILSKMNLSKNSKRILSYGTATMAAMLVLAGCKGVTQPGERAAREQFAAESQIYHPDYNAPALPVLTMNSPLSNFVTYAIFNHPDVAANYYDWAASIEGITVERSRPDPKLTFEAYIAGTITSIMPGLMTDIPGPGKLAARADLATAESEAKYFAFKSSMLQTAFGVKKAYYDLSYHNEEIRVNRESLQLVSDLEQIARAENETGKGTLQDVLRTQSDELKLRATIANLHETHRALFAQFKASLGMTISDPDPPTPGEFAAATPDFSDEQLLQKAMARNLQLKGMAAEIKSAEASIKLARKERVPDFSAGGEVDVKAAPVMWNPQLSMTLPIWRDKIAAQIAAAQANKRTAEAKLTSAQISLAVTFAEKMSLYREANRNLSVIDEQLMPRARQSLDVARAAYLSGRLEFINVIDAQRELLNLQLERVDALKQREISLAELSLIIEGATPGQSPMPLTSPSSRGSIGNTSKSSGGM